MVGVRIDPAGLPFIVGGLVVAAAAWVAVGPVAAVPGLAIALICLFFFRDPHRDVRAGVNEVLSPADGRVMIAGAPVGKTVPPGQWQQISIFLSPMDVHVNRIPIGGTVTHVEYHPGRFLPAYRTDAGDLNEHTEVHIDHGGQRFVVRQIVGLLARRVVCRIKTGAVVQTGDRFGVMKFGSRMDVFVPVDATISVAVNDRVVAGVTVLARLTKV